MHKLLFLLTSVVAVLGVTRANAPGAELEGL